MNVHRIARFVIVIVTLISLSHLLATSTAAKESARQPNIIVIVGDDMGYADIGVHGSKQIPTPHIDSLAKNGVRCTSGYVSGPYCSPTRAGLLTGRYQQRFGHEFNPGQPAQSGTEIGLPLTETTLADRLKAAGYKTGMVGKWHLGAAPKFNPVSRGFEEYFGFLGGAHTYFPAKAPRNANTGIYRGLEVVDEKEYLTEAFAREAVAYIDRHQKDPFFLYLTFNAVHNPLEATDKYLDRFDGVINPRRKKYVAMMSAMDDAIGQVLAKLKSAGLEEETLVFFISDNGGPPANMSRNGPLRGFKAQTWEGGIRVPYLVQWKGKLPAGKVYDQPVIQLDIHSTALAAAGVKLPAETKLDGVNLFPYLRGDEKAAPHERLYWRFGQQMAIRQGNYKLVKAVGIDEPQLFDLTADIGESKELTAEKPEVAKELQVAWNAWNSELVKPLWGPPRQVAAQPKKE